MSILGEAIGRIANDLVHREKFKRPIVMCAVGANGSVLAGDYPRGRLPIAVEYFCERLSGSQNGDAVNRLLCGREWALGSRDHG
jgi:hypothetical protein